jgi:hypothetical protein
VNAGLQQLPDAYLGHLSSYRLSFVLNPSRPREPA